MSTSTATAPRPIASRPKPLTYARARLWLGIMCVGFQVVLATTALLVGAPQGLLPTTPQSLSTELAAAVALFAVLSIALLPFDIFGGFLLPNRFTRVQALPIRFAAKLTRGVLFQTAIFAGTFVLYRRVGVAFGGCVVVGAFIATQLTLVAVQLRLARWVGSLKQTSGEGPQSLVSLGGDDSGFTGGIAGLPGFDRIVIPAGWAMPKRIRDAAALRRMLIIKSGLRRRGLIAAIAWNTVTFSVALLLPGGGYESLAALATAYLYFSLLSFVGLLLLPMFSRRAIFTADALTATRLNAEIVTQLAACMDEVPEGEASRSAELESVFHPVPCVARRVQELNAEQPSTGGVWNVARTALFTAWAFGGPLSRSVHCNIGRPELWVFLPTD